MFSPGDQVLARFTDFWRNDDFSLAFGIFSKRHHAFDLANDRKFFRFAGLEKFSHSRQTASDVFGLRGLSGDFGYNISRLDALSLRHVNMRPNRQQITGVEPTG